MKIIMTSTRWGKEIGKKSAEFKKGETFEIEDESLLKVFLDNKWATIVDEKPVEAKPDEEADKALKKMSIPELRKYADKCEIDLGDVTAKKDILEIIEMTEDLLDA